MESWQAHQSLCYFLPTYQALKSLVILSWGSNHWLPRLKRKRSNHYSTESGILMAELRVGHSGWMPRALHWGEEKNYFPLFPVFFFFTANTMKQSYPCGHGKWNKKEQQCSGPLKDEPSQRWSCWKTTRPCVMTASLVLLVWVWNLTYFAVWTSHAFASQKARKVVVLV